MKRKVAKLIFNISLSSFLSLFKAMLSFARRDGDEFQKFGVMPENIMELNEKFEVFANIPTDEELTGDQVEATQERDAAAGKLTTAINEVLTRAANKFGVESGKYRKFGVGSLSSLTDSELSVVARRVERVAILFLDDLKGNGLTQQIIDEVDQKRLVFDAAVAKQLDAIADRDIASENRVNQANALYAEMVKLTNLGKQIWVEKNEAKYNDYVIYNTPSGKEEAESTTTVASAK